MKKIIEKLNKLSLPATILIASVILGGFYYASQVSKQNSIEKQQQAELQASANKEKQAQSYKETKQIQFEECMTTAHEVFVNEGSSACVDAGYTQTDIDNLKCKLSATTLKRIEDKQTQAQDMCLKISNN